MAAKGTIAKNEVLKKIAEAFGEDFIGEIDKKIYVWANDGTERVQIAISMTCPKVFVEAPDKNPIEKSEDWDFSDDGPSKTVTNKGPATITEEEKQKVADLMKSLGL